MVEHTRAQQVQDRAFAGQTLWIERVFARRVEIYIPDGIAGSFSWCGYTAKDAVETLEQKCGLNSEVHV